MALEDLDFEKRVEKLLPKILKTLTKENTPFEKTLAFIKEERENRTLDAKQYTELTANLMNSLNESLYKNTIYYAIEIAKHDETNELKKELLEKQIKEVTRNIASRDATDFRRLGVTYDDEGNITYLNDGKSEVEKNLKLLDNKNNSEILDIVSKTVQNKKVLGVTSDANGTITYDNNGDSEIELKLQELEEDIALKKVDKYKNYGATLNSDGTISYEENEEKLKYITHWQKLNVMAEDIALKKAESTSLIEQTEDNRIIKNMSELAEYVNALGNNDLIAGVEFHQNFLAQQKALLLKNGFTFTNGKVYFMLNDVLTEIGTWNDSGSTTSQS